MLGDHLDIQPTRQGQLAASHSIASCRDKWHLADGGTERPGDIPRRRIARSSEIEDAIPGAGRHSPEATPPAPPRAVSAVGISTLARVRRGAEPKTTLGESEAGQTECANRCRAEQRAGPLNSSRRRTDTPLLISLATAARSYRAGQHFPQEGGRAGLRRPRPFFKHPSRSGTA